VIRGDAELEVERTEPAAKLQFTINMSFGLPGLRNFNVMLRNTWFSRSYLHIDIIVVKHIAICI